MGANPFSRPHENGAVAQPEERGDCTPEVAGSTPVGSTTLSPVPDTDLEAAESRGCAHPDKSGSPLEQSGSGAGEALVGAHQRARRRFRVPGAGAMREMMGCGQ